MFIPAAIALTSLLLQVSIQLREVHVFQVGEIVEVALSVQDFEITFFLLLETFILLLLHLLIVFLLDLFHLIELLIWLPFYWMILIKKVEFLLDLCLEGLRFFHSSTEIETDVIVVFTV